MLVDNLGGGIGLGTAIFSVWAPDFRVFGAWAILIAICARERQFEWNTRRFSAEQGPIYALIAAIRGRMPRMFITRVRL